MTNKRQSWCGLIIIMVAAEFVVLQTLDGRNIHVNPRHVVSIGEPRDDEKSGFTAGAHCVISMLDGKFITVTEQCASVRKRIEEAR